MTPPNDTQEQPVVIGYDGSDHAKHAIAEAGRLFPGRRAVVATVFPSAAANVAAASIGAPVAVLGDAAGRMDEAARQAAQERADEGAGLAREAGLDAEGTCRTAGGAIWATLGRIAEDVDALTVVVGPRGLAGLKQVLLGSTSSGLVHHCPRPVVVVPGGERPVSPG